MSTQLLKLLNRPGRYAPEVSKSLERLENASKVGSFLWLMFFREYLLFCYLLCVLSFLEH